MAKPVAVPKAPAVSARRTRAEEDAFFERLSAAFEKRRRNESPEQRIERWNREQYERFLIGEHEKERLRSKSRNANLKKTRMVELRREAIIEFWPTAREIKNRDKRHDRILEHLAERGFKITERTLISADLPRLREWGLLGPR